MTYEVRWSRNAVKDLRRLDKFTVRRIVEAVDTFAATGRGDVKKLTNSGGEYRLRVGDWRVRFTVDDEVKVLSVVRVLPRGEAYKR
ncbi:MAG: type II toxin-antitoxin system RelE/ParE family toxin [Thermoflavifilum sp.]|nr:type II toxin-antitoxin system RelE/ParE family toxin [Thermoflavifilum sp.]MCL6513137.1 type II toxin-antitoxin system RelE/ParE family toxin [Alicyclobacillus sp.]